MYKQFSDYTIKDYVEELSSREIVPGGGSVSALMISMAAGLNLMVINFSYKEDSTEDVIQKLDGLKADQLLIRERAIQLIDEDCDAFRSLMKSLNEKKDVQENLKNASIVPLDMCRICEETIRITGELLEIGNKNLLCDVGCACNFIKAANDSARLNVEINMKYIKDKTVVTDLEEELMDLTNKVDFLFGKISKKVAAVVRG